MNREDRLAEIVEQLKAKEAERASWGPRNERKPTEEQYLKWAKYRLHQEEMAAIKDTSVIPVGYYCYGTSPREAACGSGTKGTCPYWSNPLTGNDKHAGTNPEYADELNMDTNKWVGHCSFLEIDSDYNDRNNSSMIWDHLKECGQNPEPLPTPEQTHAFNELKKVIDFFFKENPQVDCVHIRNSFNSKEPHSLTGGKVLVDRGYYNLARQLDPELLKEKEKQQELLFAYADDLENVINSHPWSKDLESGHSTVFTSPSYSKRRTKRKNA